uniref:Uncharacterized protein n=1 Tax=Chromera velia CCMP2878 TaxID=1169474 RepID=A0A0G4I1V4_9ALVE|eukprot:Cvel_10237.t1-p1 / transcript=Cvel_10237.t1 / gene=Cvel_10237 / organism=Chromera_velia_CCMP2878 / gene_product=U3 small nucleolar RNA-associated protein 18, putative / transcript_product=U3 small nucleolar RNA-associated protein 18, putative / location=Cvel_scaffold613:26916-32274(+) / protein_length=632 / sequence_SO=supercontig / SO=protein_coding / is_pseudo=false
MKRVRKANEKEKGESSTGVSDLERLVLGESFAVEDEDESEGEEGGGMSALLAKAREASRGLSASYDAVHRPQKKRQRQQADSDDEEDEEEENDEEEEEDDDEEEEGGPSKGSASAWVDEDDADVTVDISAVSRLRKLRETASTAEVDGQAYQERLRHQFNQIAAGRGGGWADRAREEQRRQREGEDEEEEEESEEDSDEDENIKKESPEKRRQRKEALRKMRAVLLQSSGRLVLSAKESAETERQAGGKGKGKGAGRVWPDAPPEEIDVLRVADANQWAPAKTGILSVNFHPRADLLLCCSRDKRVRLFQIDGEDNPLLSSLRFRDRGRLSCAKFSASGEKVIASFEDSVAVGVWDLHSGQMSRVPGFFSRKDLGYPLLEVGPPESTSGRLAGGGRAMFALGAKNGSVLLVDERQKSLAGSFAMSREAAALCFQPSRPLLFSADGGGDLYCWDIRSSRCRQRISSESLGTLRISSLDCCDLGGGGALGTGSQSLLAIGSNTGIVSVFGLDDVSSSASSSVPSSLNSHTHRQSQESGLVLSNTTALKDLKNLVTEADSVKFHPSGQLLCVASSKSKDALRLVHSQSLSVYLNWPRGRAPAKKTCTVDFSADGRFLAMGDDKGAVKLVQFPLFS